MDYKISEEKLKMLINYLSRCAWGEVNELISKTIIGLEPIKENEGQLKSKPDPLPQPTL